MRVPQSGERRFHQPSADALALVIVADDHQADSGVVALGTGERAADQPLAVHNHEAVADPLQHCPVFQAVRPFELYRQGVGGREVGHGHWAVDVSGVWQGGHGEPP